MADKRKSVMTILLKNQSNDTKKVELFRATDFSRKNLQGNRDPQNSFRLRINGKWFPEGEVKFFWKSEIRDLLFKGMEI